MELNVVASIGLGVTVSLVDLGDSVVATSATIFGDHVAKVVQWPKNPSSDATTSDLGQFWPASTARSLRIEMFAADLFSMAFVCDSPRQEEW